MSLTKLNRRIRIKQRIRKKVSGTQDILRLTVFRSNKHIYAQAIDDNKSITVISASSKEKSISSDAKCNKIQQAELVGKLLAERANAANISKLAFDRNGYLYHGRVKVFADAVRNGGIQI